MQTLSQSRAWDKGSLGKGIKYPWIYIGEARQWKKGISKRCVIKWTTIGLVELTHWRNSACGENTCFRVMLPTWQASCWIYTNSLIVIGWGLLSRGSYFPSTSVMPSWQEIYFCGQRKPSEKNNTGSLSLKSGQWVLKWWGCFALFKYTDLRNSPKMVASQSKILSWWV